MQLGRGFADRRLSSIRWRGRAEDGPCGLLGALSGLRNYPERMRDTQRRPGQEWVNAFLTPDKPLQTFEEGEQLWRWPPRDPSGPSFEGVYKENGSPKRIPVQYRTRISAL